MFQEDGRNRMRADPDVFLSLKNILPGVLAYLPRARSLRPKRATAGAKPSIKQSHADSLSRAAAAAQGTGRVGGEVGG